MNRATLIVAALTIALSGCEQDAVMPDPAPVNGSLTLNGYDSELIDTAVNVYTLDQGLNKGSTKLLVSQTDAEGRVTFENIGIEDQFLLIEMGGEGHYYDEYSSEKVLLTPSDVLSAILFYKKGDSVEFAVTGFTHLAAKYAKCLVDNFDLDAKTAVESSNTAFSALATVDIEQTIPSNPTRTPVSSAVVNDSVVYGMLHAGVSATMHQMAKNQPALDAARSLRTLDFYSLAARDISEDVTCSLDGKTQSQEGAVSELGIGHTAMTDASYRSELALGVFMFLASEKNQSGVKVTDFVDRAELLASTKDARLFKGIVPRPIDVDAPVIRPIPGKTHKVFGSFDYEVDITDASGLQVIELYIDGKLVQSVRNPEDTVFSDLSSFSYGDGLHEFKVVAVDSFGNTNFMVHPVIVSNSSPIIELLSPKQVLETEYEMIIGLSGLQTVTSARIANQVVSVIDGKVSAMLNLDTGENSIEVSAVNRLGNITTETISVFVDRLGPVISAKDGDLAQEVYFAPDTDHESSYLAKPNFNDELSDPIYLQASNVKLNNLLVSADNLKAGHFASLAFTVADPSAFDNAADEILVSYSYFVSGTELFLDKPLVPLHEDENGKHYLIPLSEEYLVTGWHETSANDQHTVIVAAVDGVGNKTQHEFTFRVRYFPDNPLFDPINQ